MGGSERVFVGLGANLGDAAQTLHAAIAELAKVPGTQVVRQSSFYGSAPVEAQGPEFVNAVAELRCGLDPVQLLHELHRIESGHGRLRPFLNAPRTLDLDLLMFGQRCVGTAELQLPHPRLHQRAFVLQPLLELDADLEHPVLGPLAPFEMLVADQVIRRLP